MLFLERLRKGHSTHQQHGCPGVFGHTEQTAAVHFHKLCWGLCDVNEENKADTRNNREIEKI